MGDDENPGRVMDEAAAVAEHAAETARANMSEAAASMKQATEAGAAKADEMNSRVAQAATQNTTAAFTQARERLSMMAFPFSNPAFDTMRQNGDTFGKGLESSYTTAVEGMAEFNSKAIAAWRSNAESAIEHWQNLAGVKSLSEAITLSTEHTRKQLEALSAQTRELSALATRIVRDAADPLKLTGR